MDKKIIQQNIVALSAQMVFIQNAITSAQTALQHTQTQLNDLAAEMNKPEDFSLPLGNPSQFPGHPSWARSGPYGDTNWNPRFFGERGFTPPAKFSDGFVSVHHAVAHHLSIALRQASNHAGLKVDFPQDDQTNMIFTIRQIDGTMPLWAAYLKTCLEITIVQLQKIGIKSEFSPLFVHASGGFCCDVQLTNHGAMRPLIKENFRVVFRVSEEQKSPEVKPLSEHDLDNRGTEIPLPDDIKTKFTAQLMDEIEAAQRYINSTVDSILKAAEYAVVVFEKRATETGVALIYQYRVRTANKIITKEILVQLMRELSEQWRQNNHNYRIQIGDVDGGVAAYVRTVNNDLLLSLNFIHTPPAQGGVDKTGVDRTYLNKVVIEGLDRIGYQVISEHLTAWLGMTLHYTGESTLSMEELKTMSVEIQKEISDDGRPCEVDVTEWRDGLLLSITVAGDVWSYGFEQIPSTPAALKETLQAVNKEVDVARSNLDKMVTAAMRKRDLHVLKTERVDKQNTILLYKTRHGGSVLDVEGLAEMALNVRSSIGADGLFYHVATYADENGLHLDLQWPDSAPYLTYTFVVKA